MELPSLFEESVSPGILNILKTRSYRNRERNIEKEVWL